MPFWCKNLSGPSGNEPQIMIFFHSRIIMGKINATRLLTLPGVSLIQIGSTCESVRQQSDLVSGVVNTVQNGGEDGSSRHSSH